MLAKTLSVGRPEAKSEARIWVNQEKGCSKPLHAALQPIAMSGYLHCPECAHCAAMPTHNSRPSVRPSHGGARPFLK